MDRIYILNSGEGVVGFKPRLLPPATKLWQGNVFAPVCQSFCSQGVWPQPPTPGQTHPVGRNPLGRHSPRQTPPRPVHARMHTPLPAQCMLGYGQQTGGTHLTGIHTCFYLYAVLEENLSKVKRRYHFKSTNIFVESCLLEESNSRTSSTTNKSAWLLILQT